MIAIELHSLREEGIHFKSYMQKTEIPVEPVVGTKIQIQHNDDPDCALVFEVKEVEHEAEGIVEVYCDGPLLDQHRNPCRRHQNFMEEFGFELTTERKLVNRLGRMTMMDVNVIPPSEVREKEQRKRDEASHIIEMQAAWENTRELQAAWQGLSRARG